jgi:hypothetical protein
VIKIAITPTNICMGPATLYWGAFGSAEPLDSQVTSPPSSSVWTDVGAIADGTSVLLEVGLTYTDIAVEQLVDNVAARLTKRSIQVTASLTETTLANWNLAMNQLTTSTAFTGYSTLDPVTTSSATQPTYTALIIDGWAPTTGTSETSCRRRIIVRKCLSASKLDQEFEKSKPATFATTWTAYYVSNSIPPFHIVDQTS